MERLMRNHFAWWIRFREQCWRLYRKKAKCISLIRLPPEEIRAHTGRDDGLSGAGTGNGQEDFGNFQRCVTLKLFPVAASDRNAAGSFDGTGNRSDMDVPPERTSGGEPIQGIAEYHVYRGEVDPASAEAASKEI